MRIIAAAAVALFVGAAHAQQPWPSKPVRLVIANAPGAITDVAGRIFSDMFARQIGQPVIIENRPGGDGLIGAQAVVSAPPDGYTLFLASVSTVAIDPHLRKSMPFDPARDFTAIAMIVDETGANGIFAHPSAPFSSLQGLIEFARANPGKLSYATTVPLFSMIGEWIQKRAGISMTEVRYKGTPQATQDALAGQVPVYIQAYGTVEPHVKAGKLRMLALTVRQDDLPGVPTVADVFPGFSMRGGITLLGPAPMAPDTVARINAAAAAVVKDPRYKQQLKPLRWENTGGARSPQEVVEFIRLLREEWGRVIAEIGRKPE
jgi:tripartite-type tricarboxylate transporter receptor subunit TctC